MSVTTSASITTSTNLHKYVEDVVTRQFKKNTVFYGMWEKRTLATGDHQYQFNLMDRNTFDATAATLVEWTTPTEDNITWTSVIFDMTQYGRSVLLSDIVVKDNPFDVYTEAATELWRQLAEVVDWIVQTALAALDNSTQTQVIYGATRAARANIGSTDYATAALCATAFAVLESKAAPKIDGAYVWVTHPFVMKDLLTESTGWFFEVTKYSQPENIFNGEIGKLYGIRFVVSPAVKKFAGAGSGSIDVYPTYIIWQKAYGIVESQAMETIIKPIGSSGSADPLNQRGSVWVKIRFGAKVLKAESNFRLENAVSVSATLPY